MNKTTGNLTEKEANLKRATKTSKRPMTKEAKNRIDLKDLDNKVMPLEEFLLNFYKILIEYVNSADELPKVFNLYVIRTKMIKSEVEIFKKLYNNSLIYYRNENPEIIHLVNLLKHNDKDALDFFIAGKQVLLQFYDINQKNMSFPIAGLEIKISDWMKILKCFWFFKNTKQTEKLEEFIKHVLVQNENYLTLNGIDFLIAVFNFYLKLESQNQLVKKSEKRKTIDFDHAKSLPRRLSNSDFHYLVPKFENKGMTIGKSAQKFNKKAEVVLPVKKEREDYR